MQKYSFNLIFPNPLTFFCIILPVAALSHEDNEVFARAPEHLWIGDAQSVLLVGIAIESVAA